MAMSVDGCCKALQDGGSIPPTSTMKQHWINPVGSWNNSDLPAGWYIVNCFGPAMAKMKIGVWMVRRNYNLLLGTSPGSSEDRAAAS